MQRQIDLLGAGKLLLYFLALPCTLSAQVHVAGELTQNATWSGAVILDDTVTVPSGIVLSIEPGTVVSMKNAVSIIISGQLLAEGTEANPIRFTRSGAGITWKQIRFVEAADSRLTNCIFEYANCAGDHKDYYNPGPKRYQYHEAVVLVASHVDFEKCVFQNLPSAGGQGDAIAIFSDDPNHPGNASANFRSCRFLSIGQGIHTRYSYVLVEDCYFVGKTGDNDDVDLYGESTPPPLVRRNLFDMPSEDDRVHPTKCSAIITENVIKGSSSDHGIVLRDKSTPIVTNNVISNCPNGGIAVENACTAILVNNTIVNCTKGIHCFDLGRVGFPYYLTPGGGTATVINCIIWDCSPSIQLEDSPNTQAKDRGSHVTVSYCDIKGGRNSVSVSGTYSTVAWGQGNINADPQFAAPGNRDYHLKSQAGRWNPLSQSWVQDALTSPCIDAGDPNSDGTAELWPHGQRINMGAYGGTPQASMSLSEVGNIADLNNDELVDHSDMKMLANKWSLEEALLPEDFDRNGIVNFADFAIFADNWLRQAKKVAAGETLITYVHSPENGNIAVRIQLP
jgi:hypothetical protein